MKEFSKRNKAKAEFLSKSFPSVYANTVANIPEKDHKYDMIARKIKEYISRKQTGRKSKEHKKTG
jgi:hypothetical protein